jgi:hypothetical protein
VLEGGTSMSVSTWAVPTCADGSASARNSLIDRSGHRRYRVDGLRFWERRESCWFVHTYHVPEQLVGVISHSDGRDVAIYGSAHYERVATKQASKKEIRDAQTLLRRDPLADPGANN